MAASLRGRFRRSAVFRTTFHQVLHELHADPPPPGMGISAWLDAHDHRAPAPGPALLAAEWWSASRADAGPRRRLGPPVARLGLVWRSFIVVERHPEARWVVLELGRGLDDEGLLDGPFDERSMTSGGPVNPYEPGPSRLAALVTVAGYADQLRHGRRRQWRERAIEGVAMCPTSAAALAAPVRSLLAGLARHEPPLPDR